MVQRAVNVKAKAGLISNIIVYVSDIYCPRSHCFSNNITSKVQTQKTTIKDSRLKKITAKNSEPALPYTNMAESLKQSRKNKKKKTKKGRQDTTGKWKKQISTTNNNIINAFKKKKNCDISKIRYFNYNIKSYYVNTYTKPRKI